MMRGWWTVITLAGVLACGSSRSGERDPLREILPAENAAWVRGGCQPELARRNVDGLCAVVMVARDLRPARPADVLAAAVRQGTTQMIDQAGQLLKRAVEACVQNCGNLPRLPRPQEVPVRVVQNAVKGVRATDLSLARSGDAYVLLVLGSPSIFGAIRQDPQLDDAAKEALVGRVRDVLKDQR